VVDPSLKLGPPDSDQELTLNAERTVLFAVNSGSNTIAAFQIHSDGSLTDVPGSPFNSGGSDPVSIGIARDALAVVNKAEDPNQPGMIPNYASFRVGPDGQISTLLSEMNVTPGISPSQALVSSGKNWVFGADFLGGLLRSFQVQPDGSLLQTDLESLPASESVGGVAPLPLGLAAHPDRPVLYVGFVTVSKIGVYTYDAHGKLTFVRSVQDSGAAVCWLRTNANGTRLYASNTGDRTITVYDTTNPLQPVEMQKVSLKGNGNAFQIALDPTGAWLYVVTQRSSASTPVGQGNTLQVLRIQPDSGVLSDPPADPITLPSVLGARPQGVVAVQPLGQ
jgi:6-phosphogluconolactonase (cycloisomerase 2 family)